MRKCVNRVEIPVEGVGTWIMEGKTFEGMIGGLGLWGGIRVN